MKFMRTEVTSCTIPGTLNEIRVLMVRNEKSSNIFQMYYTNKQNRKLTMRLSEICTFPSEKIDAIDFKESEI